MIKEHGLKNAFEIVANTLGSFLDHSISTMLPLRKRESLENAAEQLSTELDRWCDEHAPPPIGTTATAILGLAFSFHSPRHGLGCVSASDMASYQAVLHATPPETIRQAIQSLLAIGLLQPNDHDLFRYTPNVSRPFSEVLENVGSHPSIQHTEPTPSLTSH